MQSHLKLQTFLQAQVSFSLGEKVTSTSSTGRILEVVLTNKRISIDTKGSFLVKQSQVQLVVNHLHQQVSYLDLRELVIIKIQMA